jgi:hypothetical protein
VKDVSLLSLVLLRFGRVPCAVTQVIQATDNVARLDAWLDNFVTAQTLADVGISVHPV